MTGCWPRPTRRSAETGLANLRARSLAEAVGCSVGAIYGVFADLDALVLAVNGRTLDAIDAMLRGRPPARPGRTAGAAGRRPTWATRRRTGPRWRALFQHRMPEGGPVHAWYAERQVAAFSHIEGPLAALRPDLPDARRVLLARTLFSAVHGMVELGLDEKVASMPLPVLRAQLRTVVEAVAARPGGRTHSTGR